MKQNLSFIFNLFAYNMIFNFIIGIIMALHPSQIENIQNINESKVKLYMTTAGGGHSFFSKYMSVPGASKTIIGGNIPYSKECLIDFLNEDVTKFVSEDIALKLAQKSYSKANSFEQTSQVIGIGVTASLSYPLEREGRINIAHIAIFTPDIQIKHTIEFITKNRDRQEDIISNFLINLIYWYSCDYNALSEWRDKKITSDEYVITGNIATLIELHALNVVQYNSDTLGNKDNTIVLYPGSFNPFHKGHKEIVKRAKQILNKPIILEISMNNADKGLLDLFDVKNRVKSIWKALPNSLTILTEDRLFIDKINNPLNKDKKLIFVMGSDTWNRMTSPQYLATDHDEFINVIKERDVKFLVFNRNSCKMNEVKELADNIIHHKLADNFDVDISSSELRHKNNTENAQ